MRIVYHNEIFFENSLRAIENAPIFAILDCEYNKERKTIFYNQIFLRLIYIFMNSLKD